MGKMSVNCLGKKEWAKRVLRYSDNL